MTGFNNPIVGGGGALVYPSIHSPNFITGSTGWSINKNGTAEFNSLTVRNGTIISGVFLQYSSAIPAKGNLVVAFAPLAAGTDSVGNNYPQGFNFGVWDAVTGNLDQHFGMNASGDIFLASSTGKVIFHGRASDGAMFWYNTNGEGANNLRASIAPQLGGTTDPAGNVVPVGVFGFDQLQTFGSVFAGAFVTYHPSTVNAETWQVVAAGSFLNSFSAGGTAPRYQLEGTNGKRVRLSGAVNTGAINGANTAIFNLPAGYRPARQFQFATPNNITAYTLGQPSVQVTTGGDVQLVPASTAGKFVVLDGICFELD